MGGAPRASLIAQLSQMFSIFDNAGVNLELPSLLGFVNSAANKTFAAELSMATLHKKSNKPHASGFVRTACSAHDNVMGLGSCGIDASGHSHAADINAID